MQTAAVLGAGTMGAGIAQAVAMGGYSVILRDLQISVLENALAVIKHNLEKMKLKNDIDEDHKRQVLSRIKLTTDLSDVVGADLVIESVVENISVKKQIFAQLDNICRPDTILATTTSSFSVTEIAAATQRKDQVIGVHFFNPVLEVKLVEIVKGLETSAATLSQILEFVDRIGKQAVVIARDTPGNIVNRLMATYINEAIFLYGSGIADVQDIDLAMELGAGMKKGPLKLADAIGLDYLYNTLLNLLNEFRDNKYRPHTLLTTMIRGGYCGEKSGRGFYKYP